ncbi:MAG: hypothetical protein EHM24_29110, partial [Acidobacteria bacterium]
RARAEVSGLVLRHRGRTDVTPLIRVDRLQIATSIFGAVRRPTRIQDVRLEGLKIHVPPGGLDREDYDRRPDRPRTGTPVVIDEIQSEDAVLEVATDEPSKPPLRFDLHRLSIRDASLDRPLRFDATLTNPKPEGSIETTGEFGPFDRDEPRRTPVEGRFTFTRADLATVGGIAGMLSSSGEFTGALGRIAVKGKTKTPDFRLKSAGHAVPLETTFRAVVDGTNGNTFLDTVRAELGSTTILAEGAVAEEEGEDGRSVTLDVRVRGGRLEDTLRLALKSRTVPMRGTLRLDTSFALPPGDRDVIERLRLDGAFSVADASFGSARIQKRVDDLSERARGEPDETAGRADENVVSDLKGRFTLRDSVLRFTELAFAVPGATVTLTGTCDLQRQELDLRGTLRMHAKVSETTSGVKSFFLKLLDPLFKGRRGGSAVPITITGKTTDPSFGVDVGRMLGGKK